MNSRVLIGFQVVLEIELAKRTYKENENSGLTHKYVVWVNSLLFLNYGENLIYELGYAYYN